MSYEMVRASDVNVEALTTVAKLLAMSGYFDAKGTAAQAIAQLATKILAGREWGYGQFTRANGINIIQGRPAVSANLMAAAVKASGRYDYRVKVMTAEVVTIEFFQVANGKRESLGESTFTAADAKVAGTKNMTAYPRNMLFARAMSNGVKWFCPDVFNGSAVYVPEELGVEVDGEGNVIDVAPRVKWRRLSEARGSSRCVRPRSRRGSGRGPAATARPCPWSPCRSSRGNVVCRESARSRRC